MVVALQANYLEVELDAPPPGTPARLLCTRRTRLIHRGAAVHVGDRVTVEAIDAIQARAVVADVEPGEALQRVQGRGRVAQRGPPSMPIKPVVFCSRRSRPVCGCSWCSPRATFLRLSSSWP